MGPDSAKVFPITTLSGIKRDGTAFEGDHFNDGQWVRWQRGLPRKMGGYLRLGKMPALARGCNLFTENGMAYIHFGSANAVFQTQALTDGGLAGIANNRTPVGFTGDPNMLWQFGVMYDATSTTTRIIAHAAPNLTNIDNSTTGKIYLGDITATGALTEITNSDVSGGIAVLHPYMFFFGSNGLLGWSDANKPDDLSGGDAGEGRVTGGKVLYGTQTRAGAGNAPAGLFWATDALIRAVYVGGSAIFNFDRIAESYSILSSQCVVEYDGIYYWIGVDRFFAYNGVIQELPNRMNRNYFFDNLNMSQRQKVWGTKISAFGEIWWHYPTGDSEECNAVVIFNIKENTWYDSILSRSTGASASIYPYPIMFESTANDDLSYNLWKHELGNNRVEGLQSLAIQSYVETSDFFSQPMESGPVALPDNSMEVLRLEPDFILEGSMTMQVLGRKYAQDQKVVKETVVFDQSTDKLDIRSQSRITSLRFESNEVDGDFQMGKPLLLINGGDLRPA